MKVLAIISLASIGAAAMAQVNQVGVFTGALNDGFETYGNLVPVGPSFNFLGGLANNSSPDPNDIWMSNSHGLAGSKGSFSGSTYMVANNGNLSPWTITFGTPMARIGGFWQSAFDDSTLSFEFYNGSNTLLNTITVQPPNVNALQWYGFEYSGGIGKVVVTSSQPFQMVDNFTADAVPEPATIAALSLGAVALLRRRKK